MKPGFTAQTNVQLYDRLLERGWSPAEVAQLGSAYIAAVLVAGGLTRASGKSSLSHLVGVADMVSRLGGSFSEVEAGLLHNALGRPSNGGLYWYLRRRRNRCLLAERITPEALRIVTLFGSGISTEIPEVVDGRWADPQIARLQVANMLEEIGENGPHQLHATYREKLGAWAETTAQLATTVGDTQIAALCADAGAAVQSAPPMPDLWQRTGPRWVVRVEVGMVENIGFRARWQPGPAVVRTAHLLRAAAARDRFPVEMIGRVRRILGSARRELRARWVGRVTTVESVVADAATFADHRVVITGAGGILGRRLVAAFVAGGATVWAVDRAEEKLSALDAATPGVIPVLADMHDPTTAGRIVDAAASPAPGRAGPVILVHGASAGTINDDLFELDRAAWNLLYDEQVSGPAELTLALVPAMRAAPGSSVVFISSINGVTTSPWPAYAAAKAGVVKMVEDFAAHFARDGIRVNGVAPARFNHGPDLSPNPKLPLTGRDLPVAAVAHAVLFLADSRRSPLTTGVVLRVDGGQALYRDWAP